MILEENLKLSLEEIPAFTKNIVRKLAFVEKDQGFLFDVRLSLHEALINAVKHGNKIDKDKQVSIKIVTALDKVYIEVKDEGKGFDYNNIALPTLDENLEKPFGRGIFLIKNFMDEVEFFDNGRVIKMVKYIK